MSSIVLFDDKKDCCGCGACMNVCPKNAIRMAEDEVGFVYPEIDQNLCVGCGVCKKACGYQMNNSFFLCFVSYVAVMLSVADVSQLLWVIIALYITYNAKAQAIASE